MEEKELKIQDNITLTLRDEITNEIIEEITLHNLITNVGKEFVSKLINGVATNFFDYIAIGTGVVSPSATDTTLGTEQKRQLATLSYEASYKAKFVTTFTFASGETWAITELGVFDASASGNMLNRATFSAINVSPSVTLTATVTITVS